MRLQIKLRLLDEDGTEVSEDQLLDLDKTADHVEAVGLSLSEAKELLNGIQTRLVIAQAADHARRHRGCPDCGRPRRVKGSSPLVFRSAFGTVRLSGPRLHYCSCESTDGGSFGLLSGLFTGRTAPELLYLESRWASLMSYGLTADLLADVLPVGTTANPSSIRNQVQRVARRCDAEIATERHSFIDGCPADWGKLPVPEGPIVVGVDGGYVRQWDDKKSNFEMIVGKSVPEDRDQRYFGFVQTIDDKPRKRFTKKQQMQWSRLGAHRLLQIRTRTLDGTLRRTFQKWYPGMKEPTEILAA